VRIDRWLWCARFFKTRSLAASAVRGGKVRLAGERVKAAREVSVGDVLAIHRGASATEVRVLGLPVRRGPAAEAAALYEETEGSIERRQVTAERRRTVPGLTPPTQGRPDKRTRRLVRHQRRGSD